MSDLPRTDPSRIDAPALLDALFQSALAVARPAAGHYAPLPAPPQGRTIVLGAGKAAASMAAALEEALAAADWPSPVSGVVVARYGYAVPTRHVVVREAAHPAPDQAGLEATAEILAAARAAGPDDLVIFLISGGASALLVQPLPGLTLGDKQATSAALLRSGAPIDEMNAVRSALSQVKGGGLARAAAGAGRATTYAISDVPGDDPAVIGSGPTVAPRSGPDPAAIARRWRLDQAPDAVLRALARPDAGAARGGAYPPFRLIAAPQLALEAAAASARAAGVAPMILGDAIEGEAREVAQVFAGMAGQVVRRAQPLSAPCVLLSGGEVTVTVRGAGRGGPNAEWALALALALGKGPAAVRERVWALACDTDGVDGAGEAGARIGPDTLAKAAAAGLDPGAALAENDAHRFFADLGDQVVTGPTLTNVNDFRAVLIL